MNNIGINISVIVPIYNAERYLSRCIDSLVNQKEIQLEIILVDDGSTDNSGHICDNYKKIHKNITVIHKKNEGVAKARNDGLNIANGDYVIFVDSDDEVPECAYIRMWEEVQKTNADIIIGDVYRTINNKRELCHFFNEEYLIDKENEKYNLIKADLYKEYCPNPYKGKPAFGYGGPWNKLVNKKMLLENNIVFDSSVKGIFDDIIYTAYIYACAKAIRYISEPVYNYYIYDNSLTHKYKDDLLEINECIFLSWNRFLKLYDKNKELVPAFYANVMRRFTASLDLYFYNKQNKRNNKEIKKELFTILSQKPYNEIPIYAEWNYLSNYHRLLLVAIKLHSVKCTRLIYILRVIIKYIKK